MTIDIIRLKALATAVAANQYDSVALNDYSTALAPATVLGLIAEIERHHQINAEGCKPDSNILLSGPPRAEATPCRSLDTAEGCKPDLNILPAQTSPTALDLLTPEQASNCWAYRSRPWSPGAPLGSTPYPSPAAAHVSVISAPNWSPG